MFFCFYIMEEIGRTYWKKDILRNRRCMIENSGRILHENYYQNGNKSDECIRINGVIQGIYQEWNKRGKRISIDCWKYNNWNGPRIEFNHKNPRYGK